MTIPFVSIYTFTFLILLTHLLHHKSGEPHEWALYYATLAAALFCTLFTYALKVKKISPALRPTAAKRMGVGLLLLSLIILPYPHLFTAAFTGALVGSLFTYLVLRRHHETLDQTTWLWMPLLSALAWSITYRAVWWEPNHLENVFSHFQSTLIFIGTLLFVVSATGMNLFKFAPSTPAFWIADGLSLILLAAMCLRPYRLHSSLLHHQGFYVGPLELMKQGGILLWDIPSQYGFLNLYLASKLNFGVTWLSFMTLHRVFIYISAVILYFFIASVWRSNLGRLFSFMITAVSIFFWSGSAESLTGPLPYPSVAAFRFTWCYFLIFYCYIITRRTPTEAKLSKSPWLNLGNCLWCLGVFWSSESAIYSSALWLTFRFVLDLQVLQESESDLWRSISQALLKQVRLLIWPLGGLIAISFLYLFGYGHFPDWRGFYEYALIYKNGFGALPIDIHGGVWAILCLFVLLTMMVNFSILKKSKYAALSAGALMVFWSISSYFVSRSHENNVSTLVPLFFLAFAVCLRSFLETSANVKTILVISLITIPFSQMLIETILNHKLFPAAMAEYKDPDLFNTHYLPDLGIDYDAHPIWFAHLREMPKELEKLRIARSEPVVFVDEYLGQFPYTPETPQFWIPLAPEFQFEILPPHRKALYLKRFAHDRGLGGWLLSNKHDPGSYRRLVEHILVDYRLVESRSDGDWLAEKFEPLR